mmetsp:Transcript_35159/g.89849  ORF Transcript_35159/g.89849 Transcript_35159/m.89849 type:complete len:205 (+) Transcript_35159:685-1299(+)
MTAMRTRSTCSRTFSPASTLHPLPCHALKMHSYRVGRTLRHPSDRAHSYRVAPVALAGSYILCPTWMAAANASLPPHSRLVCRGPGGGARTPWPSPSPAPAPSDGGTHPLGRWGRGPASRKRRTASLSWTLLRLSWPFARIPSFTSQNDVAWRCSTAARSLKAGSALSVLNMAKRPLFSTVPSGRCNSPSAKFPAPAGRSSLPR